MIGTGLIAYASMSGEKKAPAPAEKAGNIEASSKEEQDL